MAKAWSFARVLRHLYDERKTGVLRVHCEDETHTLHIRDGSILDVTSSRSGLIPLHDYLIASDMFTRGQLKRLHRKAESAGYLLDDYLVQKEYLASEVVARYVELQIRETVLGLFGRVGIRCELDDVAPQKHILMGAQPILWFLKEAKRRAEHWPRLRKRIPHSDIIFDKVDEHIAAVLGDGFVLHTVRSESSSVHDEREDTTVKEHLGAGERSTYYFANGHKTVTQLAFAAGLGEFDAYQSLVKLYDRGYIHVASDRGPGERSRIRVPGLAPLLSICAWLGALAAIGGLSVIDTGASVHRTSLQQWQSPYVAAVEEQLAVDEYNRALEIYEARYGEAPEASVDLVQSGILDRGTVSLAAKILDISAP